MTTEVKQKLKGQLAAANALRMAMEKSLTSSVETHWRYVGFRDYMIKYQQIVEQVSKLVEITAPDWTLGYPESKKRDGYDWSPTKTVF